MPSLDAICTRKLEEMEAKGIRRRLAPWVAGERGAAALLSFAANDPLGLARSPQLAAAAERTLRHFGAGAGASRLVSGNHPLHGELEAALARYKHTDAACIFGSGYLANLGVIPALMGREDLILADKLSHACMLDGAQLSRAKTLRFPHNDMAACRRLLEQHRATARHALLMTEHVFSMDGDIAPLRELAALAREFDCWLLVDDAHGIGVVTPPMLPGVDVLWIGTLSKALGSYGGFVCASQPVIDYVLTSARSLIYTTALPPSVLSAAYKGLRVMQAQPWRGEKALTHARRFTEAMGLPPAVSHIVPWIIGRSEDALQVAAQLKEEGFFVPAIRPPTVPEGTARLRFSFSAAHRPQEVDCLIETCRRIRR